LTSENEPHVGSVKKRVKRRVAKTRILAPVAKLK